MVGKKICFSFTPVSNSFSVHIILYRTQYSIQCATIKICGLFIFWKTSEIYEKFPSQCTNKPRNYRYPLVLSANQHMLLNLYLLIFYFRSSRPEVFCKNGVLRNFKNSQESTCVRVPLTLAQVFSCEFYEISKNTFLIEHHWWLLLWFQLNVTVLRSCIFRG